MSRNIADKEAGDDNKYRTRWSKKETRQGRWEACIEIVRISLVPACVSLVCTHYISQFVQYSSIFSNNWHPSILSWWLINIRYSYKHNAMQNINKHCACLLQPDHFFVCPWASFQVHNTLKVSAFTNFEVDMSIIYVYTRWWINLYVPISVYRETGFVIYKLNNESKESTQIQKPEGSQ